MNNDTSSPRDRMYLTDGRFMRIDPELYDELARFVWYPVQLRHTTYAATKVGGLQLLAHRLIASARYIFDGARRKWKAADVVDHRNRDGLDNRRENLRLVTAAQNQRNTRGRPAVRASRYKGVSRSTSSRSRPWRATIEIDGRQRHLGYFSCEETAARAYDAAALENWGPFAFLNFRIPEAGGDGPTSKA